MQQERGFGASKKKENNKENKKEILIATGSFDC